MPTKVYTDGACSGNPGIGGWGVVIIKNDKIINLNGGENNTTNNRMELTAAIKDNNQKIISGKQKNTTNNQMELTAAIKALEYFKHKEELNIFTDSKYLKDGIESWIINWKKNGWRTKNKKPVKNKELWIKLDNQIQKHKINWHWVKGHSDNPENDRCDELAVQARKILKIQLNESHRNS